MEFLREILSILGIVFALMSVGFAVLAYFADEENELSWWGLLLGVVASVGMFLGYVVARVALSAAALLAVLLAADFLYPGALEFSRFEPLIEVVVYGALMLVGAGLLLDRGLRGVLDDLGLGEVWSEPGAVILVGVALAPALLLLAEAYPEVEVSGVAAVAAGVISAFTSYYVGLYLREQGASEEQV